MESAIRDIGVLNRVWESLHQSNIKSAGPQEKNLISVYVNYGDRSLRQELSFLVLQICL
jgi:hypothetical protein